MTQAQLFNCPSCGGPLDLEDNKPSIRCEYCNNSIIVPSAFRSGADEKRKEEAVIPLLSPVELGNIRLLVANGRKIDAIKRLRQLTDLGLKEAKEIADAMQRGDPIGSVFARHPQDHSQISDARLEEINTLVQQGKIVQAIKLMRESADLSMTDARSLVEALRRGESITSVRQTLLDMYRAPSRRASYAPNQIDLSSLNSPQARKTAAALGTGISCTVVGFILFILTVTLVPILFAMTVNGGPLAPLWSKINPVGFASVELTLENEGIAPGSFNDPRAIAVDRDGNFYVADYSTGRLQSFNNLGIFRWLVNLGDETTIQALDVSAAGELLLVSQGSIRRFQVADGKELDPFPDPGTLFIDDVSVAPDGSIAVIVNGQDLLVYDSNYQLVFQISQAVSSVTADSELDCDVAVDALGNIFILGHFNNKVLNYTPEGRFINQFGGETTDQTDGKFRAPGEIAVDMHGRVYVSDIFGIQVFSGDGQYLEQFKYFQYANGMDFDSNNNLYIASNEPQIIRLRIRK